VSAPESNPPAPRDGSAAEVAELLRRERAGDERAREALVGCLYAELHRVAEALMAGQRPDHTLQATALVSELYVRLDHASAGPWKDREHFLAYASLAMRSVLIDHARAKKAVKRAAMRELLPLDRIVIEYEGSAVDLETLDAALRKLERSDPQIVRAIVARYFAGATAEQAARMSGISPRTFDRRWRTARAWLYKELQ
jgi:RNA polymerase sigma factor (TIGR02999 family)